MCASFAHLNAEHVFKQKKPLIAALHFVFLAHLAIKANTTDSLIDLSPVGGS